MSTPPSAAHVPPARPPPPKASAAAPPPPPVATPVDSERAELKLLEEESEIAAPAVPAPAPTKPATAAAPSKQASGDSTKPSWQQQWQVFFQEVLDAWKEAEEVAPYVEEAEFSATLLKDNGARLQKAVEPTAELFESFFNLQKWHNPSKTVLALVCYYFFVWQRCLLLGFLLLLQGLLLRSYLRATKILKVDAEEEEEEDKLSLRDRFRKAKHVARGIQNTMGRIADMLEKFNNLLTWKDPQNTVVVVKILGAVFLFFLLLPFDWACLILQIFFGIKFFFLDAALSRSYRLRDKYDSTQKFIMSLPTNADLDRLAAAPSSVRILDSSSSASASAGGGGGVPTSSSSTSSSSSSSSSDRNLNSGSPASQRKAEKAEKELHEKVPLSTDEVLIESWRCMLLPSGLSLPKPGKLWLTERHLHFTGLSDERISIPMQSIQKLAKKNPLSFLPGNGFSIEVFLRDSNQTHVFGALVNRDKALITISEVLKLKQR